MDTPTMLLLAAAIAGAAAIFLHVFGKEKHRLESAYKEQRRQIIKARRYEENMRRQNEEARQAFQENAAGAVEQMVSGAAPATPTPAQFVDEEPKQPA